MVASSKDLQVANRDNLTEEECKQLDALITKSQVPQAVFKRAKKGCKYWTLSGTLAQMRLSDECDVIDNAQYKCHNYFLTKEHATNVAAYLKSSMWFINKAVEFAGDYKFKVGAPNYYVDYWAESKGVNQVAIYGVSFTECKTTIYMTEVQAAAFKAWLIKHAPEGELRE